ncbi:carboxypeptidase-like regulatory domain-containing protein [Blastopirellula retiformator]|uniref:Carboxypeptidase regulatory-like domain-containing protein n=1 Tax=Blastopirellula retiformator TaxID=2527970 RepID=A0A5C5V1F5_9BACT|nr:carboxypeptidase-like regulatory domain-containing protein [Blastopirellula retiformator]TWT31597.1 hypothetical protein Enr8_35190 [Blastopirellula retiformator]
MQATTSHPIGYWLIVGLLAFSFGCSGDSIDPEYKPVTGTVTLDGQPLANAQVSFVPFEAGSSGAGFTDQDGVYRLYYAARRPGAKMGENKVFITKEKPLTSKRGEFSRMSESDLELLPARYNRRTELTANVTDQTNVIDFELKSK